MSAHTNPNHTIIYAGGKPVYAVVPFTEYEKWVDENTYIPHEVVALMVKHGCNLLGAWRRFRGLTQTTLADKMGVKQQAVAQMEKTDNNHTATLESVAEILECDINQLSD